MPARGLMVASPWSYGAGSFCQTPTGAKRSLNLGSAGCQDFLGRRGSRRGHFCPSRSRNLYRSKTNSAPSRTVSILLASGICAEHRIERGCRAAGAASVMTFVPIYLLIVVVMTNRYLAGLFFKAIRGRCFDQTTNTEIPSVAVVIPMFNEGKGIYDTIVSLLGQDYPEEKLSVTVIDDCSTDDSCHWAKKAAALHPKRIQVLENPHNVGKRRGIARAVRQITAEIVVSVDSDVLVDRGAVRELVRRFVSSDIAAVGGRVNVSNPNDNWLTRMQTIKYHFGFTYLKSLERAFRTVLCLSGCLTAYRRSVLLELEPILEDRNVLGVPIKYGEDRFLTRQIVKAGYRTVCTMEAKCWTVAPSTLSKYFSQQLRWRRSNFVDFLMGLSHVWRLHPCVSVHYYSLFAIQLVYPVVLVQSLVLHEFWALVAGHLLLLAALGAIYAIEVRRLPPEQRVHPLWFMGMGIVMPVTYLVQNVLSFWTLDSGSWETRSHVAAELQTVGDTLHERSPSEQVTAAPIAPFQ
jgi:N-acetylglucosaminyltransferase